MYIYVYMHIYIYIYILHVYMHITYGENKVDHTHSVRNKFPIPGNERLPLLLV